MSLSFIYTNFTSMNTITILLICSIFLRLFAQPFLPIFLISFISFSASLVLVLDFLLVLRLLKPQLVSRNEIVFLCFSKTFPHGEYVNLACSIILL